MKSLLSLNLNNKDDRSTRKREKDAGEENKQESRWRKYVRVGWWGCRVSVEGTGIVQPVT